MKTEKEIKYKIIDMVETQFYGKGYRDALKWVLEHELV